MGNREAVPVDNLSSYLGFLLLVELNWNYAELNSDLRLVSLCDETLSLSSNHKKYKYRYILNASSVTV